MRVYTESGLDPISLKQWFSNFLDKEASCKEDLSAKIPPPRGCILCVYIMKYCLFYLSHVSQHIFLRLFFFSISRKEYKEKKNLHCISVVPCIIGKKTEKKEVKKNFTGRGSNPSLPLSKRVFYHWTTGSQDYTLNFIHIREINGYALVFI